MLTPIILDSNSVLNEIQAHLNYCLPCYRDIPLQSSLYFTYTSGWSSYILPLIISWLASLLWSQLDKQRKLSIYYREKLQLSLPEKLLVSNLYISPRLVLSPVYRIISWHPIRRLLQISDSSNFILEIQVTCASKSYALIFELYTQSLELWGIKPVIKSWNWIRRSSNTGILIESNIIFVDESYKIR